VPLSRRAAVLGGLLLLLTACAGTADGAGEEPAATASSVEGFPVTVSSCGTETTLQGPPERIVTIKSSATEMVIALGAGDRLGPEGEQRLSGL